MKQIRRWHLFLSCFFAPMLVFYLATGWYQTLNTNRNINGRNAFYKFLWLNITDDRVSWSSDE